MNKITTPFVSIIVPTYNRPAQLAVCLQACARLDYPRDCFEVIVVDDRGTAPLDDIVARFYSELSIKLLKQNNSGPGAARNKGASEARGKFLAFTDDDCSPAPNWLRALVSQFIESPDCAVGGQTLNALTQNIYSTASQLLISYLFSHYNAVTHDARFLPSNNLALPAGRFHAIGGFDVTYLRAAAEDRELGDRWLQHGYRMIYTAKAVVYHAHDLTIWSFMRQHFHYGQGAFSFRQVRAKRTHTRIMVEPPSFYFNMCRYPFVRAQGITAFILMLLLVVTQVANAVGFYWARIKGTRV